MLLTARKMLILRTDYCVAAFGIIIIISGAQWIIDGRKNFTGPRIHADLEPEDTAADNVELEAKATEEHIES